VEGGDDDDIGGNIDDIGGNIDDIGGNIDDLGGRPTCGNDLGRQWDRCYESGAVEGFSSGRLFSGDLDYSASGIRAGTISRSRSWSLHDLMLSRRFATSWFFLRYPPLRRLSQSLQVDFIHLRSF